HEIVLKMYGIKNYVTAQMSDTIIREIAAQSPEPKKGAFYVAHPAFHSHLYDFFLKMQSPRKLIKFLPWYKEFLAIPQSSRFEKPQIYPKVSADLKKKVTEIGNLKKIAIISPEAKSLPEFDKEFWERIVKKLSKKGYKVICNVLDEKKLVKGTIFLPMTSEELIALALATDKFYSIRSGVCDLIFIKGKNLTVYYPNKLEKWRYSINSIFNRCDIVEKVISKKCSLNQLRKLLKLFKYLYK
ncbi:MAG: hypothetical protein PHV68_10120, partial [Candidatus Gastranaerophilales bacterium]|nr:hypothetical protein [Candidatus Gastranaerophilales bacterium]